MAVRTPLIYDGTDVIEMTSAQIATVKKRIIWLWGIANPVSNLGQSASIYTSSATNGYQTQYSLNSRTDTRDEASTFSNNSGVVASQVSAPTDGTAVQATFTNLIYRSNDTGEYIDGLHKNFYYINGTDGIQEFTNVDMQDTFIKPAIEDIVSGAANLSPGIYRIHTGGTIAPPTNHSNVSSTVVYKDTRYGNVDGTSYYVAVADQVAANMPDAAEPDTSSLQPFFGQASFGPTNLNDTLSTYESNVTTTTFSAFDLAKIDDGYNDGSGFPGNESGSGTGFQWFDGVSLVAPGTGSGNSGGFAFEAGMPDFHSYFSFKNNTGSATESSGSGTAPYRDLNYKDCNLKAVSKINFYVKRGTNTNGGEVPDSGENLYLQYYATNNSSSGGAWVTLKTMLATDTTYNTWEYISITIPTSTIESARLTEGETEFRFHQSGASANGGDMWGITGIEVEFSANLDHMLMRHVGYAAENLTGYRIKYQVLTATGNTFPLNYTGMTDTAVYGPVGPLGSTMNDTTFTGSTFSQTQVGDTYTGTKAPSGSTEINKRYGLFVYRY